MALAVFVGSNDALNLNDNFRSSADKGMTKERHQGSFMKNNSYALREHVPWYVAFAIGGDLRDRTDPHFDSTLELSIELLAEWRAFHARRGNAPVIGLHFPLQGDHLLRAMARLGLGPHTLSRGTADFLSTLANVAPFRECYLPMPFLEAIEAEGITPPPLPSKAHHRRAEGAWLANQPQSAWSRRHTAVDGQEGYLWYAAVYAAQDGDAERSVDIQAHEPTTPSLPVFSSLWDWLGRLRSQGIRIVPVLAATETSEHTRALAHRCQELLPPKGLVYQNSEVQARVPPGWWELSTANTSELRLE